jgi:hypothetical protein
LSGLVCVVVVCAGGVVRSPSVSLCDGLLCKDVLGEAEAGGGGEDGGEGFGSYDTVSLGPDLSHPRLPEYIARQAARGSSIGELGTLVTPKGNSPGWLIIVKRRLYFAPIGDSADGGSNIASVTGGGHESAKLQCWPLNAISAVYARRYRLVDSALEFFLSRGKRQSVFVDFGVTADDVERRDEFIRLLGRVSFCSSGGYAGLWIALSIL